MTDLNWKLDERTHAEDVLAKLRFDEHPVWADKDAIRDALAFAVSHTNQLLQELEDARHTKAVSVEIDRDDAGHAGVYLYGEDGRAIVLWVSSEMNEAPVEVACAIARHMRTLYEQGGDALRRDINHPDGRTAL